MTKLLGGTLLVLSRVDTGNVQGDAAGHAKVAAPGSGSGDVVRAADTLVLLDTMLVSSYMQCSPPRHSTLVSGLDDGENTSLLDVMRFRSLGGMRSLSFGREHSNTPSQKRAIYSSKLAALAYLL